MEDLDFTQDAETPKYLSKKGVYKLKVNEYKWSKEIEGYNKTPFVRFMTEDVVSGGLTSFTLWFPTPKDNEKKAAIKKKIIKEFLENLGCNLSQQKGKELLDCSIGKICKVALREKERIIERKSDGKPMVVSDLDYYYSGEQDKPLKADESKMVLPITAAMKEDFEQRLAKWKQENEPNAQAPAQAPSFEGSMGDNSGEDDDFPF